MVVRGVLVWGPAQSVGFLSRSLVVSCVVPCVCVLVAYLGLCESELCVYVSGAFYLGLSYLVWCGVCVAIVGAIGYFMCILTDLARL